MSNQINDFENIKSQTDFVQFLQMVTGKQVHNVGSKMRMNPCPNCTKNDCYTIYANTKSFNCFSCGWGGDMFTLIQKVHNLSDKREVLIKAAELTNIGLSESQTEATRQNTQKPAKKIFSQSAAFYEDLLLKDKAALKILKETRYYDVQTVNEFNLGYTGVLGTDRQKLYSHLRGLLFCWFFSIVANIPSSFNHPIRSKSIHVKSHIKRIVILCKEPCVFGDEGHCGRTQYEYRSHCEKLFNEKKEQRG